MFHKITLQQTGALLCKWTAVCLTGALSVSCHLFISTGDISPPNETEQPPPEATEQTEEAAAPCDPITTESIALIQFEETISEEKITLIDPFLELGDEGLQNCFQAMTDKELMGLTFFDLSRHTNPVLAKKAKDLTERFHPVSFVEEEIKSGDEERREKIVEFLLRIEPDRAEKILNEVSFETEEEGNQLKEEISNGVHRVLIPTDSSDGDRYYVRAEWDPANEEQINCLTDLFNKKLSGGRSLSAENAKMKSLNGRRWVYWYSKDWAVSIASAVEKCEATAVFVPGPATGSPAPLLTQGSETGSASVSPSTTTEPGLNEPSASTTTTESGLNEPSASMAEPGTEPTGSGAVSSESGKTAVQENGDSTLSSGDGKSPMKMTGKAEAELNKPASTDSADSSAKEKAKEPSPSEQSPLQLYDSNKDGKISCAEARKHKIAPVKREHPAYRFMNNRNNNEVACERRGGAPRKRKAGRGDPPTNHEKRQAGTSD